MKRQWLVVAAVVVAVALAVVLVARKPGAPDGGTGTERGDRVFHSDSLGVRLRIPDSPGWTLRADATPGPEGRVVTALHEGGTATVRLLVSPATDATTIDTVFEARQRQIAAEAFSLQKLDTVIDHVFKDEKRDMSGRLVRQWQAVSSPIEVPGEPPARLVFMWLLTTTPRRVFECIGMARFPAAPDPATQQKVDALLGDIAYILQSFEVR